MWWMARGLERLGTRGGLQLASWYVGLLVATLAFKHHYLDVSYPGGLRAITRPLAGTSGGPLWAWTLLLFASDVLEVALIVATTAVVGRGLFRIPFRWLVVTSGLAAVAAGGANVLAVKQLGGFLSADLLASVWAWVGTHPDSVLSFITPRRTLAAASGVLWAVLPIVAARLAERAGRDWPGLVGVLPATVLAIVGVTAAALLALGWPSREIPALRGYWSTVAVLLAGREEASPRDLPTPAREALVEAYRRVAFPRGAPAEPIPLVEIPAARFRRRHVVIVSLETAAQKYYRLADGDDLPTFRRMAEAGVVSDLHYTAGPHTTTALYGILTGTYPRLGALPTRYGPLRADALPLVLAGHGYETAYIEASVISSGPLWRRTLDALGFHRVLDADAPSVVSRYDQAVANEERAFRRALDWIGDAAGRGRYGFVCLVTSFGHFPWKVRPGDESLPAAARLRETTRLFDGLLGGFLAGLAARQLEDQVLIVVTGDHGPRFLAELESLGEAMGHGDATFNVPLLIYAPGLLPRMVRVPHVTSHVDLAPTLLEWLGVGSARGLYHGLDLLDGRLAERVTFLPSAGLYPVDGFYWRGSFYTENRVTGRVTRRQRLGVDGGVEGVTLSDGEARRLFAEGRAVFETTAAYFLSRGPGW